MNLVLNRYVDYPKEHTDGGLFVDGVFFCDTLEDPVRDLNKDGDLEDEGEIKIYGDTAIPYGDYDVMITWSPKFQKMMLLVMDVKHFKGIRVHGGATKEHTLGCILVGRRVESGRLIDGRATSKRLFRFVVEMCVKHKNEKPVEYNHPKYGRTYKMKQELKLKVI